MKMEKRVTQVWSRIKEWLEKYAPLFLHTLAPPASLSELAELETLLGRELPADFRLSYSIHNGQILRGHGWDASRFIFDQGLRQIQSMIEYQKAIRLSPPIKVDPHLIDTYGPLKIGWHEFLWIPFSCGNGYQTFMLDLDPPPEGTYGQVIESISDEVVNRWVAKSFVDYLEFFAAALEAGIYVFWESSREKGIVSVESLEWR